jgi:large subunit ribosomal protein L25
MPMQQLTIKRRTATGKEVAKRLRREGVAPAILYGGARPEPITVDPKAVFRILHGHAGSTQLVSVQFENESETRMAIIRDLQFDPVSERLLHMDLQEVSADRPITVNVAVHPVGEAAGVKDQAGMLNLALHEVEIECLPGAIPERLDVDVTALRIGDVLTVGDLRLPEGVRVLNDVGQAVATVIPPRVEEAAVPAVAAPTTAEPEVLTERKMTKPEETEEARKGKK